MSDFTYNMEQRASFARELEYIKEDMDECGLDDRFEQVHGQCTKDDYCDCKDAVDQIDPCDDTKKTEVRRLLDADKDMSFEKMIGVVDDIDDKQNIPVECGCQPNPVTIESDVPKADDINLKGTEKELGDLQKEANEQVEESVEEKYIDVLMESAEYLSGIAKGWDQNPNKSSIMRNLVIESVVDSDESTTLFIKRNLGWFDGRQVVITQNKETGEVVTKF